jgi:hypothetical protein
VHTAGAILALLLFSASAMAFIDFTKVTWQLNANPAITGSGDLGAGNLFSDVSVVATTNAIAKTSQVVFTFAENPGSTGGADNIMTMIGSASQTGNGTVSGTWGTITGNNLASGTLTTQITASIFPNNMFSQTVIGPAQGPTGGITTSGNLTNNKTLTVAFTGANNGLTPFSWNNSGSASTEWTLTLTSQ